MTSGKNVLYKESSMQRTNLVPVVMRGLKALLLISSLFTPVPVFTANAEAAMNQCKPGENQKQCCLWVQQKTNFNSGSTGKWICPSGQGGSGPIVHSAPPPTPEPPPCDDDDDGGGDDGGGDDGGDDGGGDDDDDGGDDGGDDGDSGDGDSGGDDGDSGGDDGDSGDGDSGGDGDGGDDSGDDDSK